MVKITFVEHDGARTEVEAEPGSSEAEMIDFSQDVTEGVRLACQTKVSAAMDGMVVDLPESQHY
jgi:2Fe-2S ferredoxin